MKSPTPDRPRAVFVGGTESGQRLLDVLVGLGVNIVGIVSWHQRFAGTVSGWANFGPVARQLNVPSILVEGNINDSVVVEAIGALKPDVLFVLAWGQLLRTPLLSLPRLGVIGRHNALLPARRGRAPVAWALIHGLTETGVTLFWMDEGVDSGDIIAQRRVPIACDDYPPYLLRKLDAGTEELLREVVPLIHIGECPRTPQDHTGATYTHPRRPDMGLIDWEKSVHRTYNFVRGLSHPYHGAFTYVGLRRVNVWRSWITAPQGSFGRVGEVLEARPDTCAVQTGDGVLRIPQQTDVPLKRGEILG